jgi:hypothetical protein
MTDMTRADSRSRAAEVADSWWRAKDQAEAESGCPNCGQPAASGHHASENLDACPVWTGTGWAPRPPDTAPCSDCGQLVDYLNEPWYAIDSGGLCVPCGQARGLNPDEYLMA